MKSCPPDYHHSIFRDRPAAPVCSSKLSQYDDSSSILFDLSSCSNGENECSIRQTEVALENCMSRCVSRGQRQQRRRKLSLSPVRVRPLRALSDLSNLVESEDATLTIFTKNCRSVSANVSASYGSCSDFLNSNDIQLSTPPSCPSSSQGLALLPTVSISPFDHNTENRRACSLKQTSCHQRNSDEVLEQAQKESLDTAEAPILQKASPITDTVKRILDKEDYFHDVSPEDHVNRSCTRKHETDDDDITGKRQILFYDDAILEQHDGFSINSRAHDELRTAWTNIMDHNAVPDKKVISDTPTTVDYIFDLMIAVILSYSIIALVR